MVHGQAGTLEKAGCHWSNPRMERIHGSHYGIDQEGTIIELSSRTVDGQSLYLPANEHRIQTLLPINDYWEYHE